MSSPLATHYLEVAQLANKDDNYLITDADLQVKALLVHGTATMALL